MVENGNEYMSMIEAWLKENRLELAPEKKEALIFKGMRNRNHVSFNLGECVICQRGLWNIWGCCSTVGCATQTSLLGPSRGLFQTLIILQNRNICVLTKAFKNLYRNTKDVKTWWKWIKKIMTNLLRLSNTCCKRSDRLQYAAVFHLKSSGYL